jgi:DNA-binding HxlR family transcriptional regulator
MSGTATPPTAADAAAIAPEIAAEAANGLCPAVEAIALLEAKWVLFIVRILLGGPKGFNELRRAIGHCNPSTLSERLELLERNGIVQKTIHSTMPPRTSYALTCAGHELEGVIGAIDTWARAYLRPQAAPAAAGPATAAQ